MTTYPGTPALGCSFSISYHSWDRDPFILHSIAEQTQFKGLQRCGISPEAFNPRHRKQDEGPM